MDMKNKIFLKEDSRDKVYKNMFGQVITLPDECNFDSSLPDNIQPIGDVRCTCFTTCDIAEDQEKREFDIQDLWSRIPQSQFGADPRDVLKEAVANGLLPIGQKDRAKDWRSFWSAKAGARDYFDNVRSALYISQCPVGVAIYWYSEWLNVPAFGVMLMGKTSMNGHMFSVEGWKQINGEPMLIVEAWIGRKLYMPRDVFNNAMSAYGTQAWVLSTQEIDFRRDKTILEAIRDTLVNVVILLKQLLVVKNSSVEKPLLPEPTQVYNEIKQELKMTKIEQWAKAIDQWEGNTFGNNPGNLKYSSLISTWGAKRGNKAKDGGYFAKFDTPEQGFQALCNFLTLGCKDQLKSYHNARTFESFMKIYAGNPPKGYIEGIRKMIGCELNTDIKTFL